MACAIVLANVVNRFPPQPQSHWLPALLASQDQAAPVSRKSISYTRVPSAVHAARAYRTIHNWGHWFVVKEYLKPWLFSRYPEIGANASRVILPMHEHHGSGI